MQVRVLEQPEGVVCKVTVRDHLGFDLSLECMRQLRSLAPHRVQHLVFDLTQTPSIESAGIGLLAHTQERWRGQLRSSTIHCVQGPVHDILNICQMQRIYQIQVRQPFALPGR